MPMLTALSYPDLCLSMQKSPSLPHFPGNSMDGQGNILIIDDVPDNLRLLSRILSDQGYEVRSAISGAGGLMAVAAMQPDLILLDVGMPGINGYEVCAKLKADPKSCEIPVIFLSAYGDVKDKLRAFEVGGIDYITKPFQPAEVLVRVQTHLALRNTQLELQRARAEALKSLEAERELNRLKSEFVSMVSHDFRTPLTTIQGFALLLRDAQDQLKPAQQERFLNKIEASVEQMLEMLDRVLLIGRADLGTLEPKPQSLNLPEFCSDLVENFQIACDQICQDCDQKYRIHFSYEGDRPSVFLDPNLLKTILENLLSNAIKYSPEGGCIQLAISCQNHRVQIQVQDQGIGIPKESLPHLFETFYRAGNVANLKGTGLGLAIVKKCVEVQAGTLTVQSQEGIGTTFTITLPI